MILHKITNIKLIGRKIVVSFVLLAFLLNSGIMSAHDAYAQELFQLPQPGTRIGLSPAFMPPLLKGIKVYHDNPFHLNFILDKGNSSNSVEQLKSESTRLVKYFLAAITVPEKDLWVNLSPYEKDRIIPAAFGVTEMGRDLLAQDYILKQITASVIYPEEKIGKEFWGKVYAEALNRYGTTKVPIDTFNKVWIVPEKAIVYENNDSAYIVESRLKVLLEQDYLALENGIEGQLGDEKVKETNKLGSDIVREVVIPILEKEVNEGRNFAQLRQIYHSLILAIWFKDKIKESIFGKAYIDQGKVVGVDIKDKAAKDKIWAEYVEAFKKGAFNYIKKDYDQGSQQVVMRKYFSGGAGLNRIRLAYGKTNKRATVVDNNTNKEDLDVSLRISSNLVGRVEDGIDTGVVTYGDGPLIDSEALKKAQEVHFSGEQLYSLPTLLLRVNPDPSGFEDVVSRLKQSIPEGFLHFIPPTDYHFTTGNYTKAGVSVVANGLVTKEIIPAALIDGVKNDIVVPSLKEQNSFNGFLNGHLMLSPSGNIIYMEENKNFTTWFHDLQKKLGVGWFFPEPHLTIGRIRNVKGLSPAEIEKQASKIVQILNQYNSQLGGHNQEIKDVRFGQITTMAEMEYNVTEIPLGRIDKNFSVDQEQDSKHFIAIDRKIKESGFWNAVADDRLNYIQYLTDHPSWGINSEWLSDNAKKQLTMLSATQINFSDIARCVLNDILNDGEPLPEIRLLDYIANSPKVLLMAPYDKQELKITSFLAPPLGIYRIANYLRLLGIRCEVFDPNLSGEDQLDTLLKESSYDFVGFSTYEPTMKHDVALAHRVKQLSPQSKVLVGGEGAAFNIGDLLKKQSPFDLLFMGMGEFSLLDLIMGYRQQGQNILKDNDALNNIRSIAWKDSSGAVKKSPLYKSFTNDDYRTISLFFDTSIVPYEAYWEHMINLFKNGRRYLDAIDIARVQTVRLVTESHCPVGCTFCASTNFLDAAVDSKQKVLFLSPEDIVYVLKNVRRYHPGVKTIFFNDDNFMIKKERVLKFCELAVKIFGGGTFRFIGLGRVDNVDEELLKAMKSVGFIQLNYGIEHFSEKVLEDMHKKVRNDEQIRNLDLTLQSGIIPLINLIPFYPTATIDDIKLTMDTTIDFMQKGATVSYWPFVEAFKGATILSMGYETSTDEKWVLPVDQRTREAALKSVENMPEIRQKIKEQYQLDQLSHTLDVLIFFLSFYEAAGLNTEKIEKAIKQEVAKSNIGRIVLGDTEVNNARLLMPKMDYKTGTPLDITMIRRLVKRDADQVKALLGEAQRKGLFLRIFGNLRGLDGPGSTLDAPLFQEGLTPPGVTSFNQIPSTTVLASDKKAVVHFELAKDPDAVEYVAPDYGITEDNPVVFKSDAVLTARGRLPRGQIDAVGYIFRNIFGLKGVRIVMEGISPIALAGGMESSNFFNVALLLAGSMLSGADLSYPDIVALAVKLENDEFGGLTGGQGHWSCILGGAQRLIWMSGVKDLNGKPLNHYGVVAQEILSKEQIRNIEEHTMLVQAGKEYKEGKAAVGRAAVLTNNTWMDLLQYDAQGFELHKRKISLAQQYAQALGEGDFQTIFSVLNTYVDIRDALTQRWVNLMLDAKEGKDVPEYAREFARKVFQPKDAEEAKDYEVIRNLYGEYEAAGKLEALRHVSLYSLDPIASLVQAARKQNIAIFPLGAGGPGSNMMAVSPEGLEHMTQFFNSQHIFEITDNIAEKIVKGTGVLKGYMPFKVGSQGIQIMGFNQLEDVEKPALPEKTIVNAQSVNLADKETIMRDKNEGIDDGLLGHIAGTIENETKDPAAATKGGIDLNDSRRYTQIESEGREGIKFRFDPAMIQQLQNASGLTPVIVDIHPMTISVPMFLGLVDSAD